MPWLCLIFLGSIYDSPNLFYFCIYFLTVPQKGKLQEGWDFVVLTAVFQALGEWLTGTDAK